MRPRAAQERPGAAQEQPQERPKNDQEHQERPKSGQDGPRAAEEETEELTDAILSKKTCFSENCVFLERDHDYGDLGAYVGGLGPLLGPMLAVLGRSWGLCWRSWGLLGPKRSVLGLSGRSWEGIRAEKWPGPEREGDQGRDQGRDQGAHGPQNSQCAEGSYGFFPTVSVEVVRFSSVPSSSPPPPPPPPLLPPARPMT